MILDSPGVDVDKNRDADASQATTILLVEDEDRVREVMELTLTLSGYRVLSIGSTIEALEIIENYEGTIHLMITDFSMPHMNGADLAARLKRARPQAGVLYVSGFPEHEVQSVHQMSGRADMQFLQKPFTPEALETKVLDILASAP